MVAKTTDLRASPPSTTAGSMGDTVLNEAAFDVSEIFEERPNPIWPEVVIPRARIGDMTSDELVTLLESKGAEGGFLESVPSGGIPAGRFGNMLSNDETAEKAI